MNPYIGHDSQIYGIEEHRLAGGRGAGMRILEINNGKGIELAVTPDRAGDIARLRFKGINMSYMSPCGYVSPAYYDVIPHFIYFQIHCTSVKFNKAPVSNKLTFIASDSLIPGRCMLS